MLEIIIKQHSNGFTLDCGDEQLVFEDDDCPVGSLVKLLWAIVELIEPGSKHDKHRVLVSCYPGCDAAVEACQHQNYVLEDYIEQRKKDEQG